MNLTKPLIAGALAVALGLPLAACAQQAPAAPSAARVRHHRMGMRMFKNLNLTQEQQSKIQTIMQQYRQAHPQGSTPDPAARKAMRDQIDAVLTPQQLDQLKAERQKMRERREHGENQPAPLPTATP